MKSLNKGWIASILVFVFILTLTLCAPQANAAGERYGYTKLTSQAQRDVYLALAEGIKNRSDSIAIPFAGLGTDLDTQIMPQLSIIIPLLCNDYPEYFWFTGGFSVSGMTQDNQTQGNQLIECSVEPKYQLNGQKVSGSALDSAVSAFNSKVSQIISGMPSGLDAYGKALYLHDYVAGAVSYFETGDHQSAYGALIGGNAVCAGYAAAYQCLLNAAGIDAWKVDGSSINPTSGKPIPHSWNLVWIDGECYYTDVTWDDQGDYLFHCYFNLSLDAMNADHSADHPEYLPSCGHTRLYYFNKEAGTGTGVGVITPSTTPESAAVFFKPISNGTQYTCRVNFTGDDFSGWANANLQRIIEILGVSYHIAPIAGIGGEYIITLGEAGVSTNAEQITFSETSKTMNVGDSFKLTWTIYPENAAGHTVTLTSSAPSVASVDSKGNVTAKAAGTAVITATVDGKVAECRVSVKAKTDSQHKHDSTLSYIPAKEATCTETGYGAYYTCSCGAYFADKDGKTPISDLSSITVAAKGHTPSDWKYNENGHYKNCTVETCKVEIADSSEAHVDANGDKVCDVCKYPMSPDASIPTQDQTEATEPTQGATQPPATQPSGETGADATKPSADATTDTTQPADTTDGTTAPNYNADDADPSPDIWIYIVAGVVAICTGIGAVILIRKRSMK